MAKKYHVPGPVRVSYGGVDLGVTRQGVQLRPTTRWKPVTDDDHGEAPADFILVGKSCVVEGVFLDMATIAAAAPYIGALGSFSDSGGENLVGKLFFDGDIASANDLAKPIAITEAGGGVWSASLATPLDPQQLILAATQELQVPVTFIIVPDNTGALFSSVPSYL